MGMSTHVEAIAHPDEHFKKMKAIWDSCEAANIDPPNEVGEYFGWEDPVEEGKVLDREEREALPGITEYREDMQEGYQIEIAKIPENIKFIRVVNCY